MVALSKLTLASLPWPSCLAASLTSLIYSSMSSLAGSKEKVLHLSCRCLILWPWVEEYLLKCFVNSSQSPRKLPLSKLPFSCQMVQSVFKFVNILIFSEMHSFHPVFCGIYVSVRPFSWESFKDGRRNLHSGCIIIIRVCVWVKVRVWPDTSFCVPMQVLLKPAPAARVGLQASITECIYQIS